MATKFLCVATLFIIAMTTTFSTCKKGGLGCANTVFNFKIGARAYPDKDSIHVGDTIWVEINAPTNLTDISSNMIGKGYSVQAAQLEMSMVAEGYNASKCMYSINKKVKAEMPIAETIYKILWEHVSAEEGFDEIELTLV